MNFSIFKIVYVCFFLGLIVFIALIGHYRNKIMLLNKFIYEKFPGFAFLS